MNSKVLCILVLFFEGCVSHQVVEDKRAELEALKAENKRIKDDVKQFQGLQKKLIDTFEYEKKAFFERVALQNSHIPYLKFKADSLLIEKCNYATRVEKQVYHYLNYARTRPKEFCEKFIMPTYDKNNWYQRTLVETMMNLAPMGTLLPGRKLYISAECHAKVSGKAGKVGHSRIKDPKTKQKCDEYFMGECISYGMDEGLDVILQLLYDYEVPSLGHRKICLSQWYSNVGISIQPHALYGYNCVLDFN